MQNNAKLLEAQILEIQRAKAKADKELEAEKLLREQKTKVVLHRDGKGAEALLSMDVISVKPL